MSNDTVAYDPGSFQVGDKVSIAFNSHDPQGNVVISDFLEENVDIWFLLLGIFLVTFIFWNSFWKKGKSNSEKSKADIWPYTQPHKAILTTIPSSV
jgi:hypothetical protein